MFKLILNIIYVIVLLGVIILMDNKIKMLFKNASYIKKLPDELEEIYTKYDKKMDEITKRYEVIVLKSDKHVEEFKNQNNNLKEIIKEYENYFELIEDYAMAINKEVSLLCDYINKPDVKLKTECENLVHDKLNNIKQQIIKMEITNNKQRKSQRNQIPENER